LALTLTLLSPLTACGPQGSANPTGDGSATSAITVTDMTGRTVTLDRPAEKVVALTASSCEIVYALGAGSTVVGRGEYCDWPAEALAIPAVQSGAETNIEQIIALAPDLVLMETMNQTVEQVKQLEDIGIKTYVSNADDIAGTYESILQIGALMGKDAEAQNIVDTMRATFDEIASNKVTGTVYFEVSPLEYGLWAAGSDTFMDEVAGLIGLENIFADVSGWAEVSEEQVLERNPDYILSVGMYFGEGPTPDEEIAARPSWQNVTAVRNGAILNLADNELSRPGPRLADGAKALYDFVKGTNEGA
jgi:iron complex transport system substrate-binding protein